jgi:3-hydroxybutyryl-CoA dehydrogenase
VIGKIAVVGSGYMGGGMAQVFALAGHAVQIADVSAEVAIANRERLLTEAAAFEADGLFPPGSVEVIRSRVTAADSIEAAVGDVDFVEEAVFEKLEVKREALTRISSSARTDTIIGTNTSTIAIGTLAEVVKSPERFLGVHFSNPAPFIPGVELIPHAGTAPSTTAAVEELLKACGKQSARVGDVTGFVLNRLQYALFHEAAQLIEDGTATAEDIDTIVRTTFGFRLPFFGPFAIADMAGLDVYGFGYASMQTDFPERFKTPPVLQHLVDQGAFGVKSGRGFLNTEAGAAPALVAYRNRAYVAMAKLLAELGPAPTKY